MSASIQSCPICGSADLVQTPRGYAGHADTPHQYLTCRECGQVIYEILSATQREIRLYRFEVNSLVTRGELTYQIRRILKVGFDEYLIYLKLVSVDRPAEPADEGDLSPSAPTER